MVVRRHGVKALSKLQTVQPIDKPFELACKLPPDSDSCLQPLSSISEK